tara:strand:- start:5949 stop:6626 length:678 start_codon:yes stop_codon:yes gene_type:complete
MSKVVILGDGVLGTELERITKWPVESRKRTSLDIDNIEKLSKIIYENDIIINCIAFTDSYGGTRDEHWSINYQFPSTLSNLCLIDSKKLVHISTEFVYANNDIPPTEEDIPLPDKTWYAYSKLLADEYIKATNEIALICRLLHKPNPFPYPEVWNVKTSGDLVDKIAILVIELIEKKATGIFNVGTGDKNLSDLALYSKVIEPPSHVPKDTRMNLNKLKAICTYI